MSKRVIRIDRPLVRSKVAGLVGKEMNVVLQNDHTQFGFLTAVEGDIIRIVDHRNHQHSFQMDQIVELIYDEVRPW